MLIKLSCYKRSELGSVFLCVGIYKETKIETAHNLSPCHWKWRLQPFINANIYQLHNKLQLVLSIRDFSSGSKINPRVNQEFRSKGLYLAKLHGAFCPEYDIRNSKVWPISWRWGLMWPGEIYLPKPNWRPCSLLLQSTAHLYVSSHEQKCQNWIGKNRTTITFRAILQCLHSIPST